MNGSPSLNYLLNSKVLLTFWQVNICLSSQQDNVIRLPCSIKRQTFLLVLSYYTHTQTHRTLSSTAEPITPAPTATATKENRSNIGMCLGPSQGLHCPSKEKTNFQYKPEANKNYSIVIQFILHHHF